MVRVPVLSEHISLAPPIVSEDSSFLTRLFSFFIFITEKAKESVTAKGKPSGTAMTITVMAVMTILMISSKLSELASLVPNHPMFLSSNLLIMKFPIPANKAISAQ